MYSENRINKVVRAIREVSCSDIPQDERLEEQRKLAESMPQILIEAEEKGDMDDCDIFSLQVAFRFCRKSTYARARWDEVYEAVKANVENGNHIGILAIQRFARRSEDVSSSLK